jgi:hypothetical protein
VGGLRGRVEFPNVQIVNESQLVQPEESYYEQFDHNSKSGAPVVFEAWCYGENDVELGYIRVDTQISSVYTSDTGYVAVFPPLEPSANFACVSATEKRGEKTPCMIGLNFTE